MSNRERSALTMPNFDEQRVSWTISRCGNGRAERRDAIEVFEFMAANRAEYPVDTMARSMGVSRSGFYAWQGREPSAKDGADLELTELIRRYFAFIGRDACFLENNDHVYAGHVTELAIPLTPPLARAGDAAIPL